MTRPKTAMKPLMLMRGKSFVTIVRFQVDSSQSKGKPPLSQKIPIPGRARRAASRNIHFLTNSPWCGAIRRYVERAYRAESGSSAEGESKVFLYSAAV